MKILLDNLKELSGNGDYSFKKGYFQRLISRLRKLTLTPDLHQWKIWPTFVFSKNLKYIMNGGLLSSILGIIRLAVLLGFYGLL